MDECDHPYNFLISKCNSVNMNYGITSWNAMFSLIHLSSARNRGCKISGWDFKPSQQWLGWILSSRNTVLYVLFHGFIIDALRSLIVQCWMVVWLIELESIWKVSWPNQDTTLAFAWNGWENHENLSQDSQCPNWDSNLAAPKYKYIISRPNWYNIYIFF